jgi:rhomboid family GlyGly-CTERM serine protease
MLVPDAGFLTEPWRLFSGHVVHADTNHWMMNLIGLTACGVLFERACGRHFIVLLLTGIAFISTGLVLWSSLPAYVGLSGALNALFAGGCLFRFQHERRQSPNSHWQWFWLALLALDLIKIGVESLIGSALLSHSTWAPAPLAHLLGWFAGVAYAGIAISPQPISRLKQHGWHVSHRKPEAVTQGTVKPS